MLRMIGRLWWRCIRNCPYVLVLMTRRLGYTNLPAAHLSCAMTDGSASAQAAADLLVFNGSLQSIPLGLKVAQRARRIVRQNLTWALLYNASTVPLAAAGLVPPWLAAAGMSVSTLAVGLNTARLAKAGAADFAPRLA